MKPGWLPGVLALSGAVLVTGASAAAPAPVYRLAATDACLMRLAGAVEGLPPSEPPVPPVLFVDALGRDDVSTWAPGRVPASHRQLGIWYGRGTYQGIILSFFATARDARASVSSVTWLYGGKRFRNVVASWDQNAAPSPTVRAAVFGCLRSRAPGGPAPKRRLRPASLATFVGGWGGHTRGLSISADGRGRESADDGCCRRDYRMTLRVVSVSGTLTRAVAVYRVTSFRRYQSSLRRLRAGDVGKLVLRNGIVTNTLTDDFFCSGPAWGATGACGA